MLYELTITAFEMAEPGLECVVPLNCFVVPTNPVCFAEQQGGFTVHITFTDTNQAASASFLRCCALPFTELQSQLRDHHRPQRQHHCVLRLLPPLLAGEGTSATFVCPTAASSTLPAACWPPMSNRGQSYEPSEILMRLLERCRAIRMGW